MPTPPAAETPKECTKCNAKPSPEPHGCPYEEDINDNHEFRCSCCPSCTQECVDDI